MSSDNKTQKITAVMIIEVMGRPKEHLVETLEKMSADVGNEKNITLVDKKIAEPTLVKDQKDLYSSFAEVEVETTSAMDLFVLMFKYSPAHVEIIEPENVVLSNHNLTEALNEVTRRLHKYDEIARVIQMEKQILENKIKKLESEK